MSITGQIKYWLKHFEMQNNTEHLINSVYYQT